MTTSPLLLGILWNGRESMLPYLILVLCVGAALFFGAMVRTCRQEPLYRSWLWLSAGVFVATGLDSMRSFVYPQALAPTTPAYVAMAALGYGCILYGLVTAYQAERWAFPKAKEAADARKVEDTLRASEYRYRTVIEAMDEGVAIIGPDHTAISSNSAANRLLGITLDQLTASFIKENEWRLFYEDGTRLTKETSFIRKALDCGKPTLNRVVGFEPNDGHTRWFSVNCKPLFEENTDGPTSLLLTFSDVTRIKEQEETIRRLAYHDDVTGLPNRRLFMDRLSQALVRAKRNDTELAVFFMDIDGFKEINDSFGHETGDEILKDFAGRLRGAVRESDTIARYGGDEFLVLLPEVQGVSGATVVAKKMLDSLKRPFVIHGKHETRMSASIGVCLYPLHATEAVEILQQADRAMYDAKGAGRGQYRVAEKKPAASSSC